MNFVVAVCLIACLVLFLFGVVSLFFAPITGIGLLFASLLAGKAAKEVIEDV